jgi:predicted MFS family arabinose efflux permease
VVYSLVPRCSQWVVALFTPALFTLAVADVPPNERGAVMGTTSAFLDVGLGLGSATFGIVADAVGRNGGSLVGAAVAVAGLALVTATRLGARPSTEEDATAEAMEPSH